MSLPRWQSHVVDRQGNILPGATIQVIDEVTGLLAAIFSDRAGTVPLSNPFAADADGYAFFHTAKGAYRVDAFYPGSQRTWRFVELVPSLLVRDQLTADRTYFVRTDGNDSNTGRVNSAAGAFLTLARAAVVIAALDLGVFNVTVQIGNGTYTSGFSLAARPPGTGVVTLVGDVSNPSNVTISTTSGGCISATNGAIINLSGIKVVNSGGFGVFAGDYARIRLTGLCDFGACGAGHALIQNYAQFFCESINYYITGAAPYHIIALKSAIVRHVVSTVTIFGTPNFSTAYLYGKDAYFDLFGLTFSGSATGKRYISDFNSLFEVYGAGTTFLPGNIAGTTSTGGQYI